MTNDTIAAIATPHGEGGISVIRISGKEAVSLVRALFKGKHPLGEKGKRIYHGQILEKNEPVDDVICTLFKAPRSYTGEDVVEISCHGSPFITQKIVNLVIEKGARPAKPGEFTQRAYLNGRMDLIQAEAVADLIQSKTESARRVAMYQLEGRLSENIQKMQKKLIDTVSLLELELDFGEEDVTFTSADEMMDMFQCMIQKMKELIDSFDRGRVCREGIRMVIAGRPNVGKSSILNALLEKERAIVTEIAGTTRDTIEDVLDIEGVLFRIIDTAGIRQSTDPVEQEGIKRALTALDQAGIVLLIVDGSEGFSREDEALIRQIKDQNKPVLLVINKKDLKQKINRREMEEQLSWYGVAEVSATTGEGMAELIQQLQTMVLHGGMPHEGDVLLTRVRHRDCFVRSLKAIEKARYSLQEKMSQEFVAMDIRAALNSLGEIIGETTTDDILNHIFSEFCIGK